MKLCRSHPLALCLVLVAPALALPVCAQAPESGAPEAGLVDEALAALRAADGPADGDLLDLLATSPATTLDLLRAIDERTIARNAACDDEPCEHMTTSVRSATLARLDRLPELALARRATRDLQGCCAEAAVGLNLLAGRGTARMVLVLELGEPHADATAEIFAPVASAFEDAALAALANDPQAYGIVNSRFASAHVVLRPLLLRALGKTPSPESLELLPMLLGRDAELDVQVLTQLISVAREVRQPLEHGRLARVRGYLDHSSDQMLRSQAAQALGRLRDYDSVRALIDLLSDESPGVRTSAHWALRTITGMSLDQSPLPWLSWHQSQTRWWRERAPQLLVRLDLARPSELVELLRELGSKRLFRDELTGHLTPLLSHVNPQVVLMTCSAIQNLRSTRAADDLARLFDHSDADVRSQARRSWRVITGREAPPETTRPR